MNHDIVINLQKSNRCWAGWVDVTTLVSLLTKFTYKECHYTTIPDLYNNLISTAVCYCYHNYVGWLSEM